MGLGVCLMRNWQGVWVELNKWQAITYTISLTPRFTAGSSLQLHLLSLSSHLFLTCSSLESHLSLRLGKNFILVIIQAFNLHLYVLTRSKTRNLQLQCCATVSASGCLQGYQGSQARQVPSLRRRICRDNSVVFWLVFATHITTLPLLAFTGFLLPCQGLIDIATPRKITP